MITKLRHARDVVRNVMLAIELGNSDNGTTAALLAERAGITEKHARSIFVKLETMGVAYSKRNKRTGRGGSNPTIWRTKRGPWGGKNAAS